MSGILSNIIKFEEKWEKEEKILVPVFINQVLLCHDAIIVSQNAGDLDREGGVLYEKNFKVPFFDCYKKHY